MYDVEGQTFGNYQLIRLLGRGGSAKVYVGEHIHLNTQVAIKVLQGHVTEELQAKFLQEAQIIAGLEHPHIVRILDFGVEHHLPYLVMNYAPNGTLRQRHCEGSRLPLTTIETYLEQIASALQYAHERKVIHRDIKPQNALIGRNDEILLSDFGLAIVSQSTPSHQAEKRAGTLPYMAPEQFEGKAYPASDQYALGVVIYEWICGERPFQGNYNEIVIQHQLASPPSLRQKVPYVSIALEQVVFKTFAKDPTDRFASVQDFAAAFEESCQPSSPVTMVSHSNETQSAMTKLYHRAILALISISSVLVSRSLAIAQYKGHSRIRASIVLGLVLIVVIASAGLFYPIVINDRTYSHTTATALASRFATATVAAHTYGTATSQGIMSGFDAQHTNFNPYEKVLNASNVSQMVSDWTISLGNIVSTSPIISSNTVFVLGDKLYALDASTGQPLWATSIALSSSPAAANGLIYIGSSDDKLYAFDAITGKLRWTAAIGNAPSDPTVADDTVYIGSSDDKLYAFDALTGKLRWAVSVGNGTASDPTVADGVVFIGSDDHKLYSFNALTGKLRWAVATNSNDPDYYQLTVAGDIVYVDSYDGTLHAFKASSGKQLWVTSVGYGDVSGATIANGVGYICTFKGKLFALSASTGKHLWTATISNDPLYSPFVAEGIAFVASEDGKLFALATSTGKILWSASVGGAASSPIVVNGIVYVGSYNGNLYAFHLPSVPKNP